MRLTARVSAGLVAVVALVAGSSGAWADVGVLIVPSEPNAKLDGAADAVVRAGYSAVDFDERFKSARAAAKAEQTREQEALSALSDGLEAARVQYLEQRFDAMIADLTALRASTLWYATREANRELHWTLAFHLGLAHHAAGRSSAAAREFSLAHAALPSKRPAADVFGPDVGEAYAAVIAEQKPPKPFAVNAKPSDAAIIVDGVRLVGTTGRAMAPGLHAVRVTAPGYQSFATIVDTGSNNTLEVELEEEGAFAPAWQRGDIQPGQASSNKLLVDLAIEANAQVVLWVTAESGPAHVFAVDRQGRSIDARGATVSQAASAVLEQVGEDGDIAAPGGQVAGLGAGAPESSGTRTWLIAGGVGAAVVAAVIVGVVLSRNDGNGGAGDRVEIGVVP